MKPSPEAVMVADLRVALRKAEAECLEQARLNGMGSEREAKLMAENATLKHQVETNHELFLIAHRDNLKGANLIAALRAERDEARQEFAGARVLQESLRSQVAALEAERDLLRGGKFSDRDYRALKSRLVNAWKAMAEHECPGDGSTDQVCYMKPCSITAELAAPSTQEEP